MRLTVLCLGSRGDVQPFVALGRALQQNGYSVRMATHSVFEEFICSNGLEFAAVEGNPQAITQSAEGRAWLESGRNPFAFARGFRDLMGPVIRQALGDALPACRGSDAILFTGPAYYIGFSLAEKLEIPYIQSYLQPVHPTRAYPSALFPTKRRGGGLYNYFSSILGGALFWILLRPVVNQARREFLGLAPLPLAGPFPEMMRQGRPVLYGFSPAVLPPPSDWPPFLHVTGYWFLKEPEYRPPDGLRHFLEAGQPPVYVGFGSMSNRDPERLTDIVLEALQRCEQRGLLVTGWGGLKQSDLPETVYKIESAPHGWLFPQVAAVVHHGGAGTTAAGLRAGRPTVVVPFFGDQSFWGERVSELGVGPPPIDQNELSEGTLAAALNQAVGDAQIRTRAVELRARIRREDGLAEAVRLVDRYLGRA